MLFNSEALGLGWSLRRNGPWAATSRLLYALGLINLTQSGPGAVVETRQADGSLALTQLPADTPAFLGMYWSGTAWSDALPDGTPCHPYQIVSGKKIYDSYPAWTASETGITVGDKRHTAGVWLECSAITTGTTDTTAPTVPAIGGTVVDGGVTWSRAAANYYAGGAGGVLVEPAATNYYFPSAAPVTKSITLVAGTFILWVTGTGDITSSAGTATASGYGVATDGSPNLLTVTVGGTVVFTVSGTLSHAQIEAGSVETSPITTTTTAVTRPASTITVSVSQAIPASGNDFWVYCEYVANVDTPALQRIWGQYVDSSSYCYLGFTSGGTFTLGKRNGGVAHGITVPGGAVSAGQLNRIVFWMSSVGGMNVARNGTAATADATATESISSIGTVGIGSSPVLGQTCNGTVKICTVRGLITDADMIALTNGTKTLAEVAG